MKANIGSFGTFHTMDLARQLHARGLLGRVYTGIPRWKIKGLPPDKVASFPWLTLPNTALMRLGWQSLWLNHVAIDRFDRWTAAHLDRCDVYHCLSACGLHAHRQAKRRYGALTVCDRGSTHIVCQDEILADEYRRWRVPYRHIDPRVMERELQEYDECDVICVPSSFALRSFLEKGIPEHKLRLAPYGVDLSLFHPVLKRDRAFRVLYVGAVSLQKGVLYLLQAAQSLPGVEVALIGSVLPEMKALLGKYAVRFLGPLPRHELFDFYSQGSVLVMPSLQEGLALVQAQAMACGLPVIGTTHSGAEDLFTDGVEGFIVPVRDPASIREKIIFLRDNPKVRDSMAEAALRRVRQLGGWDRYGERMTAVYGDALAARSPQAQQVLPTPTGAHSD